MVLEKIHVLPDSIHENHKCTECKMVYTIRKLYRELNRQPSAKNKLRYIITVHTCRSIQLNEDSFEQKTCPDNRMPNDQRNKSLPSRKKAKKNLVETLHDEKKEKNSNQISKTSRPPFPSENTRISQLFSVIKRCNKIPSSRCKVSRK